MRRIARLLGWVLPPAAFVTWAAWTAGWSGASAIPAFGPVELQLEAWRWSFVSKLGAGALLVLGWTGAWARLYASRRPARRGQAAKAASGARRLTGSP